MQDQKTKEWIDKARKLHGDRYDYSEVIYTSAHNYVDIICKVHGLFSQNATSHRKGFGCKKCMGDKLRLDRKDSLFSFINKANNVHNNKYLYPEQPYTNQHTKIKIICSIHGEFWQTPNSHLNGCGCPICYGKPKSTLENFVEKSNLIHNNKFDYSKSIYVNNKTHLIITCPIHGDFKQTPHGHLSGRGCVKCKEDNYIPKNKLTTEEFILRSNFIHKDKYNYNKVIYSSLQKEVIIICSEHGEFLQKPREHLDGCGCQICSSSKGELLIYNWLKENNIPFKSQFELITEEIARNTNLMKIDFFVKYNNKQYFIEYDGIQHFKYIPFFHREDDDFFKQQRRDRVLNEFCELHKDKISLLRFKYDQTHEEIVDILNNEFNKITQ